MISAPFLFYCGLKNILHLDIINLHSMFAEVRKMITLDRFEELAEEAVADVPEEFFNQLNGGIVIVERVKNHEDSVPSQPLFVMGEYTHNRMMGRHIILYYGSFMKIYGDISEDALRSVIRATILHEFTHHLESLSGERDLEIEDKKRLSDYKRRHNR